MKTNRFAYTVNKQTNKSEMVEGCCSDGLVEDKLLLKLLVRTNNSWLKKRKTAFLTDKNNAKKILKSLLYYRKKSNNYILESIAYYTIAYYTVFYNSGFIVTLSSVWI